MTDSQIAVILEKLENQDRSFSRRLDDQDKSLSRIEETTVATSARVSRLEQAEAVEVALHEREHAVTESRENKKLAAKGRSAQLIAGLAAVVFTSALYWLGRLLGA